MNVKVSILIKAYNEEAKIHVAIESALAVLKFIEGEVILADSCSRDRTVEIGLKYPIRVVRFENALERGCGAGAQLAYQHSFGEFVYILDGDQKLNPQFIVEAVRYMEQHPAVVGVGGIINEVSVDNLEFRTRAQRSASLASNSDVTKLDAGGLYRRTAIENVGYFADRNLHSFEEMDLGARLRAAGGTLTRINMVAVDHYAHEVGSYNLLWSRMSSRYALGAGEIFKAAVGEKHFGLVAMELRILRVIAFLVVWIASVAILSFSGPLGLAMAGVLAVAPVLIMSLRRRSLSAGFFSVISWFLYSVGFFRGLFPRRTNPRAPISSQILKDIEPVETAVAART